MKTKILFLLLLGSTTQAYQKKISNVFKEIPKTVKIKKLYPEPEIYLLNNFITANEAQHLQNLASSRMQPSRVDENQRHKDRSSYSAMFSNYEDKTIQKIAQRAADAVGYPLSHVEGLQVVRYQKGQEFKPHHDYLPEHMKKNRGSQRIFTFFIYMNDLAEKAGGKTYFPELNLEVRPIKYAALFWSNIDNSGQENPKTLHGGMPVHYSEKWAINVWIHDKPQ
jgi:prolyl 4-hydroxylase